MGSSCNSITFRVCGWRFRLMDPEPYSVLIGSQLLINAPMTSAPESLGFIKLLSWLRSIVGWFKGHAWGCFMLNAFFWWVFLGWKLLRGFRLRFRRDFNWLILLYFWLSLAIWGSGPDSLWLRPRFRWLTLFGANSYLLDHSLARSRGYILTDIPVEHGCLILNLMFLCIRGFHLWIIWIPWI